MPCSFRKRRSSGETGNKRHRRNPQETNTHHKSMQTRLQDQLGGNLTQSFRKSALKLSAREDSERTAGKKLTGKKYLKKLRKLKAELCTLQEWVKHKGLRAIIIFEGRDAAGKGGTIKAITERVSPRVFRVVALPAPSDR